MRFEREVFFSLLVGFSAACGGGDQGGPTPPNQPLLMTSPNEVSFGFVTTGTAAPPPPAVISVTNTTSSRLGALRVSLVGSRPSVDLSEFQVEDDTCTGRSLDVGASCSLKVRFVPATPGVKSGSLQVYGPPGTVGLGDVFLFGEVTALAVEPTHVDFGSVPVGNTSAPATFTLTASTGANGIIRPLQFGFSRGFVISSDGCSGRSLISGGQCTFAVSFTPTTTIASRDVMLIGSTDDSMVNCDVQGAGQ